MDIFNDDFKDFIEVLNKYHVNYILVGGYAVILHGYPRYTGDLDIWVQCSEDNYNKLLNAMHEFGLFTTHFSLEKFLHSKNEDVHTFGIPPRRIDIMLDVKGLEFETAFDQSEISIINNVDVRLIHLKDLIKSKAAAGRHKDLNDIEHLKENDEKNGS